MNYFNHLMEESAQKWRISTRTARILFWIPVFLTFVVIGMAVINIVLNITVVKDLFRFLLEEDGPIEWVGALAFLGSGLIALGIAYNRLQTRHPWQALIFLIVALAFMFAAGEEISWGQRIFNWETPEGLAELNDQGETTLHNIGFMLQATNFAMLFTGLYGTIAYFVNQFVHIEQYWDQADYVFIPPFFLSTYFVFVFLFRLIRLVIVSDSNFTLNRMSEWVESVVAVGILLFFWLVYRYVTSLVKEQVPLVQSTDS